MTDRNDRSTDRRPAEGVRIIGAQEAQAALEAGQAAGRRAEDELRFGDVPPAPSGPRPAHRFPLPDSVDPAVAVPRPPVAPLPQASAVIRAPRAADAARGAERRGEAEGDEVDQHGAGGNEAAVDRAAPDGAPRGGPQRRRAPRGGTARGGTARGGTARGGTARADEVVSGEVVSGEVVSGQVLHDEGMSGEGVSDRVGGAHALTAEPGGALRAEAAGDPPPSPAPPHAGQGDGTTQASLFVEAQPTGRVRAFEPPSAADPTASAPVEPEPPAPLPRVEPPPAGDPPGSGLRWATPAGDGEGPGRDRGAYDDSRWMPADGLDDDSRGDDLGRDYPRDDDPGDPWADLPAPDDPTAVNQPAVNQPAVNQPAGDLSVPNQPAVNQPAGDPSLEPSWDRALLWPSLSDNPFPGAEDPDDRPGGDAPWRPPATGAAARPRIPAPPPPEEGITVVGSTDMPHWTDPPTGEVPIAIADLAGEDEDTGGGAGVRWRSPHDGWDDSPDVEELAGDDVRVGAMQDRSEESDMFSFDEAFERLEEERSGSHPVVPFDDLDGDEPIRIGSRGATTGPAAATTRGAPTTRGAATATAPRPLAGARRRLAPAAGGRAPLGRFDDDGGAPQDLGSRVAVGAGLGLLAIACYAIGAKALLALAAIGLVAAAGETFSMLRRSSGFRPATLIGLLATIGLVLGAWWKGVDALPLVLAVTLAATMVWYLLGISDARPLANVMATLTTVAWVGLLGSFGALLLRAPHGKGLFFTALVTAVLADVVAFFGGRAFGSHRLAPQVSPGKTVEGLVAGGVAALVVGAVLGHLIPGWGGFKHGVLLGLVVAVFAPIGDLFESLIKRDLDVKDSGHTLAGHGGLLDRFDSLLLVLPASYYLAVALHLA